MRDLRQQGDLKHGINSRISIHILRRHGYVWVTSMSLLDLMRKLGGAIKPHNQMQLFRDVIDECRFMDLGFVGPKFTWNKHFENGNSI